MKKTLLLLCLAAGLLSCAKELINPQEENARNGGVPMQFDIRVSDADATKAAKTAWAYGDKIYVFFNGLEAKYLTLTYSGSIWVNDAGTLEYNDFDGLGTRKLTAVHFPVAVDVAFADGKFTFTSGGKPVYSYYLFETGKDYSLDGDTVAATLSLTKPADMVQMHVAGIQANVADYTFGCSKLRPVACASVGTDGAITESALQAGARLSGFADADGGIFAGRLVYPGAEKDYKFTLASDSKLYTLTRSGRILTPGTMYTFPALSETGGTNWSVQNASELYVDLGIEVGGKKIYWAKCNVGADSETDYGDYFAWGEITGYNEGKTNFTWNTYAWGSARNALTKYNNDNNLGKNGYYDTLTTLEKEDDAAYAALGGKFRMPTQAEIGALLALGGEWVGSSSGVAGYKFTGDRGQTLFFPAAGARYADNSLYYTGNRCHYWSSSLDTMDPYNAYYLFFESIHQYSSRAARGNGKSVRPVFSE